MVSTVPDRGGRHHSFRRCLDMTEAGVYSADGGGRRQVGGAGESQAVEGDRRFDGGREGAEVSQSRRSGVSGRMAPNIFRGGHPDVPGD